MSIKGITSGTADKLYSLFKGKEKKTVSEPIESAKKRNREYSESRDKLLESYLESEPYDFNINTDKLYSQYADMYKKQGEAAMRDTVAQAAAKTGGYGSSYGVTAGSQAYQGYLDKLNSIVPELEERAYDRYTDRENSVREKIGLLDDLDTKEYESYRDSVEDYKDLRDYYRKIYEYDNDYDYNMYKALTDYVLSVAKLENDSALSDRELDIALAKLENDSALGNRELDIALAKLESEGYISQRELELALAELESERELKEKELKTELLKLAKK